MSSNDKPAGDGEKWRADFDQTLMADAAAQRKHEAEMRLLDNDRAVKVERIRTYNREDRRQRIGWALAGLAVVLVILGGITAIWTAVDRDRQQKVRIEQINQQTAQDCIERGNIWVDGDCLLGRTETKP